MIPPVARFCSNERYRSILVCDMPERKSFLENGPDLFDRSVLLPEAARAVRRTKKGPGKPGPRSGGLYGLGEPAAEGTPSRRFFRAQRPKWGRSPLRMAMLALTISSRSMAASNRPQRLFDAEIRIEAVSDIWFPS